MACPNRAGLGVEHKEVFSRLVLRDACLRRRIVGEAAMPVQVVGRDVQHQRNVRPERLDSLQLKTRHLQHRPHSLHPFGGVISTGARRLHRLGR